MIQYPTNVTPCNYAFDATKVTPFSFIFNGDRLTDVIYQICDYDTLEVVREWGRTQLTASGIVYNGEEVNFYLPANELVNDKTYIMRMVLCQRDESRTNYICDMPVVGGIVEMFDSNDNCKIYVESGITNIYPFNESNGVYSPTGYGYDSMELKINGENRRIIKYTSNVIVNDKKYGCIEIESAFSKEISSSMSYDIYSNHLITPQYLFSCYSSPTVDFSINFGAGYLSCKGQYSHSENRNIKYYILKVMWSNNSAFVHSTASGEKTAITQTTERIYSQRISYTFGIPFRHDETYHEHSTSDYYKVVCEIVTQDNMTTQFESEVFEKVPDEYIKVHHNNFIGEWILSWNKEKGCVIYGLSHYGNEGTIGGMHYIYRTDLDTGEETVFPANFVSYKDGISYGYDMTASTHGNYQYKIIMYDENGAVIIPRPNSKYPDMIFPTNEIKISDDAYYISELNVMSESDKSFIVGDTWKFFIDLADTTVTNNLDRTTHIGYGGYVSSTATDVNYMSGTLSAMIGYMDCTTKEYTDTIALVNAWRKFITQNKPFLFKSTKGDVWVVNITDNPTTTYQESYHGTPTTISFSWAESHHINDISIRDEINYKESTE